MTDMEAGSIGAGIGVVLTALGGVVAKLRSSKRADDREAITEWRELAKQARDDAAECQRRSLDMEGALGEIKGRLSAVEQEHAAIVREHSLCPGRIDQLERELRHQRYEVALIKRAGSTPPVGLYTPDDVRAAMEERDDG